MLSYGGSGVFGDLNGMLGTFCASVLEVRQVCTTGRFANSYLYVIVVAHG